jgi:hypothetical protein
VSAQIPDYGSEFQQLAAQFSTQASNVLLTIDGTVLTIMKIAYVTLLLLGVLLYFTRISKRTGKEFIVGGVVLGILSQYVIPAIPGL